MQTQSSPANGGIAAARSAPELSSDISAAWQPRYAPTSFPLTSARVQALQRLSGNQAVQRLLQAARPQPLVQRCPGLEEETAANDGVCPCHTTASAASEAQRSAVQIQRSVSFTLTNREANPGDLAKQPIVHVNTGDRVDFIDSRLNTPDLTCKSDEDHRHIVGYDLIARALRNIVKGHTVEETAAWLGNDASWIDKVNASTDRGGLAPTVPSVEDALTMWLRNGSSFPTNLFCGPAAENRSKGAQVPRAVKKVKKTGTWGVVNQNVTNAVRSIRAIDKRSQQPVPFLANGHFKDELDFTKPPSNIRDQMALNSFLDDGYFRAYPGSVMVISLAGATVRGGAFHIFQNKLSRVSRSFVPPIKRAQDKTIISPNEARKQVAESEIDAPSGPIFQTAYAQMRVAGFGGTSVHSIMETGLGEKYIHRNVSLDLLDQRNNIMTQQIVSVNTGSRPKPSKKRYILCKPGENARHKVSYDLLAKGLARTLQGATVESAAAWLDREAHWLDNRYVQEDHQPLANGKTLRALGAVEAMATNWLFNAFHAQWNLFCGNAEINQRKGRAIPRTARAVKQSWQSHNILAAQVAAISAIDKVTLKRVPLTVNGASQNFVVYDSFTTVPLPTLYAAPAGAQLELLRGDNRKLHCGAVALTSENGQLTLTRVSRSFRPASATDEPGRERLRQAHLANQIDTREPANPDLEAYPEPYDDSLNRFRSPPARAMPIVAIVENVIDVVYNSLHDRYVLASRAPDRQQQRMKQSGPYYHRSDRGYKPPPPPAPYYPDQALVVDFASGATAEQVAAHRHDPPDRLTELQATRSAMFILCQTQMNALRGMDLRLYNLDSLVIRALSHPAGVKYLPTSDPKVPSDYHRAQDQAEMRADLARKRLLEWHKTGRRLPPAVPLLTSVLELDDLSHIFKSLNLDEKELKWLRTKLHSAADGASLADVTAKLESGRTIDKPKALLRELRAAVSNNTIVFPS